ncbi:MAG: type II secretion system inner membrane protein GspF [Candidatus Riflebacteria bacterium]|nr:type II secretion system inner membrane protein GspF [Candidatus Riflebacteria bacterium]
MPVYQYEALDRAGKTAGGVIDADAEDDARRKLRAMGLYPTRVKVGTRSGPAGGLFDRITQKEISVFTRNLATLTSAGFPVVEALSSISEQIEHLMMREVVVQIREKVREGSSLSDSLEMFPELFSGMFVSMVHAGEKSGRLEEILFQLADYLDKKESLKNQVLTALAYPILMTLVGLAIVAFLLVYIVPQLTVLFTQSNRDLPLPTTLLLGTSDFLGRWWLGLLAIALVCYWGFQRWASTDTGGYRFDGFKLRMPVFGMLFRKIAISRFVRTLGILLQSGVPILQALDIVRNVVSNAVIAESLDETRKSISHGSNLATPLRQSGLFPPIVIDMIAAGQKSGQLEKMLMRLADDYDREVEGTIQMLTSLLEPVIIICMGFTVGFIVLAVLLPIYELNKQAV